MACAKSSKLGAKKEVSCNNCGLFDLCKLAGLESLNTDILESVVNRRKKIKSRDHLVVSGEASRGIFAVKSGLFKTVSYFDDGSEHVIDFHLPGELIGLEAINSNEYSHTVSAAEDSSVCEMDLEAVQQLEGKFIYFQASLIDAMSKKIALDKYKSLLIGAQTADQRLAMFLILMARRYQEKELPVLGFRLAMRKDIASHLGLALETVGRVFKRFEKEGMLHIRGRNIELYDYNGLKALAGLLRFSEFSSLN
ncbi:MAG: cyclic nucleotide-binding domain-containing protein [Gammaproteobacteria bacterium]|nr:cyclic nucleotide-binding domain-containing protein [Gammaproteobacteria bacterium]